MPQINTITVSTKTAFIHELRRQFALIKKPIVIHAQDIVPSKVDVWRARGLIRLPRNQYRAVLLTSDETVAQCMRGFTIEWVTDRHVVIHGGKVDGQLTVG